MTIIVSASALDDRRKNHKSPIMCCGISSKADGEWLEALLDAIARKMDMYLSLGAAKFLNEVAEHLAPFEDGKSNKKPAIKQKSKEQRASRAA